MTIEECELSNCGLWIFQGQHGEARWSKGAVVALLTLSQTNDRRISVERQDVSRALTALYTGQRNGDTIENGQVTWTFSNGRVVQGTWTGGVNAVSVTEAAAKAKAAKDSPSGPAHFDLITWLLAGTALGDAEMQNDLGALYFESCRARKEDYTLAKTHFLQAAAQGYVQAMINLAQLYEGRCGTRNLELASIWYHKAGSAGEKALAKADADRERARQVAQALSNVLAGTMTAIVQDAAAKDQACRASPECMKQRKDAAFQRTLDAAAEQDRVEACRMDPIGYGCD